jgi:hypothetical protein
VFIQSSILLAREHLPSLVFTIVSNVKKPIDRNTFYLLEE